MSRGTILSSPFRRAEGGERESLTGFFLGERHVKCAERLLEQETVSPFGKGSSVSEYPCDAAGFHEKPIAIVVMVGNRLAFYVKTEDRMLF